MTTFDNTRSTPAITLPAVLVLIIFVAGSIGAATYWNAWIVSQTYQSGWDHGWRSAEQARAASSRKTVLDRIPPEPEQTKSDQPGG